MGLFELVRNGGMFAMAALAAGLIGVLVGSVGFAVKGKSAIGIGVVTALIGAFAAGLGIGGTLYGKHVTNQALGSVNPVDAERIRPAGYREAQGAGWVGFGASLLPLLLGAAHILRARNASSVPVVASITQPRDENPAPIAGAALAFVGIGALAAVGALVMARAPIDLGPLGLETDDSDGWELAHAIDRVKAEPWLGCNQLDAAMEKFAVPVKGAGWPRELKREPPKTLDWRPAANACVERWTGNGTGPKAPDGVEAMPLLEQLMESPLVHDTRLRGLVLARKNDPNAGPLGPGDPRAVVRKALEQILPKIDQAGVKADAAEAEGDGLAAQDVAKVVKAARAEFSRCYERALQKNPTLAGKLVVEFKVGKDGYVAVAFEKSDPPFADPGTTSCVLAKLITLKFPASTKGSTKVRYPFVFTPG